MTWAHTFPCWPPSVNKIWRRDGGGKIYLSPAARKFRQAVCDELWVSRAARMLPAKMMSCDLAVELRFFQPDRKRRDLDNLLKSTLDAMTAAGLWMDDSQIKRLSVSLENPDPRGRGYFVMTVRELSFPAGPSPH